VFCVAVAQPNLRPHRDQKTTLGFNVAHVGNVLERDVILGEDGCSHARECGVLCTGNVDGADKRIASADDEFVHEVAGYSCPFKSKSKGGM